MKVTYEFTEAELATIKALAKKKNTYNYSMSDDAFRKKHEAALSTFIDEGLLYHSNRSEDGTYIRYSATEKGARIFFEHNPDMAAVTEWFRLQTEESKKDMREQMPELWKWRESSGWTPEIILEAYKKVKESETKNN